MTVEQKQAQIERLTVTGLLALAVAFLATAARSAAVHMEWLAADAVAANVLQTVWILGMMLFGLSFGWLWLIGRRLEAEERTVLGDEFQVLVHRRSAFGAYVVTFVVAVLFAAMPCSDRLSGDAVASAIAGVGVAAFALQRLRSSQT
jgi:hypothetical protein